VLSPSEEQLVCTIALRTGATYDRVPEATSLAYQWPESLMTRR
jgi:hypothetical protein